MNGILAPQKRAGDGALTASDAGKTGAAATAAPARTFSTSDASQLFTTFTSSPDSKTATASRPNDYMTGSLGGGRAEAPSGDVALDVARGQPGLPVVLGDHHRVDAPTG